jgi:hypothetical protein
MPRPPAEPSETVAKSPAEIPENSLLAVMDPHSRRYLGVIATGGAIGAGLGGPPGALVGAGIGLAGCAVHYVAERAKRKNGENQEP